MAATTPLPLGEFDFPKTARDANAPLWVMHCAEGPVPRAATAALTELLAREARPWEMRWDEDFLGIPQRVRKGAAAVLSADAADISLTPTTTSGLVTIAQGYPWSHDDEIVAPLGEFPSNAWPWLALGARGVAFHEVALWDGHKSGAEAWTSTPPGAGIDPEQRLIDAITPRTRVVTVSWVRFQDGLRLDLGRLGRACRQRGVELVVDGIQGAGTLELDTAPLSAFATGGHKGLLGPQGQGVLWTNHDFREKLTPPGGWLSVEDATNFDRPNTDFERGWIEGGARLEQGGPNLVSAIALAASLETLAKAKVEKIHEHVQKLQKLLLEELGRRKKWAAEVERLGSLLEAERLGSILSFHQSGTTAKKALAARLKAGLEAGIHASVREGYLRVAFHGWHTEDDVARIADWLGA